MPSQLAVAGWNLEGEPGEVSRPEIYVSTDIETDGPIPGRFSMLSLASAAFWPDGSLHGTFSVNLHPLYGAHEDPETMRFWEANPEAWAATLTDRQPARAAMGAYADWANSLPGRPVFVAYPAGFDFTFVYWYLIEFTGASPFSFSALDIKTLAMAALKGDYREATKRHWPQRWMDPSDRHTHVAIDDALEQGREFCRIRAEIFGP